MHHTHPFRAKNVALLVGAIVAYASVSGYAAGGMELNAALQGTHTQFETEVKGGFYSNDATAALTNKIKTSKPNIGVNLELLQNINRNFGVGADLGYVFLNRNTKVLHRDSEETFQAKTKGLIYLAAKLRFMPQSTGRFYVTGLAGFGTTATQYIDTTTSPSATLKKKKSLELNPLLGLELGFKVQKSLSVGLRYDALLPDYQTLSKVSNSGVPLTSNLKAGPTARMISLFVRTNFS